ncbi:MAG: hypothetical protein JJ900_13325 [Rhodospirillales bacterium]|nr:hypothetical protein [Rhodospirillales bacterium]MBO6787826.1 hypothetical protein [Rhodospirillales bacterium]
MNNPFIMAIRQNPQQFLGELETSEIKAVTEACVAQLEARAKAGDGAAPGALQALYRALANVEI